MSSIQTTVDRVRMPTFSPRTLLAVLWERAHQHLTPQELRWIAEEVPTFTCYYTRQLEDVLESLGCLISTDGNGGGSGALQSADDLPDLLFSHATHMGLISGMVLMGSEAGCRLERVSKQ